MTSSREQINRRREECRAVATEFVTSINVATACAHCGAQPIEWHREEHVGHPNWRISSLRTQGASVERIQREMDLCVPLCRSCHMAEDGRSAQLHTAGPYKKGHTYTAPRACVDCSVLTKPTRRDRCQGCYVRLMHIRCSCGNCPLKEKQA